MSEEQMGVFLRDRHSFKSNAPRDTQFQDSAKALWEDIVQVGIDGYHGGLEAMEGGYELLLTRRLYDFALHVLSEAGSLRVNHIYSREELLEYCKEKLTDVPDRTEP